MRMKSALLLLPVLFLLSACVEAPPASVVPDLTFANLRPIPLDVARIEIRDDYKPPLKPPHIEHTFPVPPYTAAANLVNRQLEARGSQHVLRVVIRDASVTSARMEVMKGALGAVRREPAEKLRAQVSLRFELFDESAPDVVLSHAEVTAKRERELLEDSTLTERDSAYFELTESLMKDISRGLSTVVKDRFGGKL